MAKVEALEATAANLNASIANACGNLSGVSQPASGDAADASTDAAAADNGSMATQTSFLDVQEQLKMFQSQFTAIKDTVQGEETTNEQSEYPEMWPVSSNDYDCHGVSFLLTVHSLQVAPVNLKVRTTMPFRKCCPWTSRST